jgi:putative DNA primase/helicase
VDKSLQLAHAIRLKHTLLSVQAMGRIFIYRDGYYQTIKSPRCDAGMHFMVMDEPDGKKMTPSKRDQVIRNIEILAAHDEDELNPDGFFCFKNCLVAVDSGNVMPHSPDCFSTIQLPYEYTSDAEAPIWRKFLSDVTEGDETKQSLLQEFAGYCLMKSCHLERALFLIGRGSNGKSVFSETLAKVFGRQNISAVSLEGLSNPVIRCNIIGKYINIDSDLPRNAEKFEESFRKIVSGEPVLFNEKYLPAVTHAVTCKLIYCLNEFPIIDDASNAFYRRMILVPFNVEFDEDSKDVDLKHKLENELAGIFRWCMEGYNRVKQSGFSTNAFMNAAIHELKADNNPIIAFAEDTLEFTKDRVYTVKRDLYDAFKRWAEHNGHRAPSYRKFNNRFLMEFRNKVEDGQAPVSDTRDRCWYYVNIKGNRRMTEQQFDFQD